MKGKEEAKTSKPSRKNIEELESISESMKSEVEAWKKLLSNLEKLNTDKDSKR